MSKVYLVGAGPGTPDLMTSKALELVEKADIIVYDSLIPHEILGDTKAELIDVGKRMGKCYKKQDEINGIIIESARKLDSTLGHPGIVVRLKGGDPFMFGRGGEEAMALEESGVPYEVVPGVTSAVSVPEHAGIPVTHRKEARSVSVITGHTASGTGGVDYAAYAKVPGTLVFLMGLNNIPSIRDGLVSGGMPADTPCAVISSGFSPNEKTVRGTLSDIDEKVKAGGLVSPAIIVVGSTTTHDFSGRLGEESVKIGICGTDGFFGRMKARLEEKSASKGSHIEVSQVMKVKLDIKEEEDRKLRDALTKIEDYGYVLFASQNAIDMFFDACKRADIDRRRFYGLKMAVVGKATAKWLKNYGYEADIVPEDYTIEALSGLMASEIEKEKENGGERTRVLALRAVKGNEILYEVFDERGIEYDKIMLYDSHGELTEAAGYLDAFGWLIFGSASGVDLFFTALEKEGISLPDTVKIACIGDPTASALDKYGKAASISANKHTAEELARLLAERI